MFFNIYEYYNQSVNQSKVCFSYFENPTTPDMLYQTSLTLNTHFNYSHKSTTLKSPCLNSYKNISWLVLLLQIKNEGQSLRKWFVILITAIYKNMDFYHIFETLLIMYVCLSSMVFYLDSIVFRIFKPIKH